MSLFNSVDVNNSKLMFTISQTATLLGSGHFFIGRRDDTLGHFIQCQPFWEVLEGSLLMSGKPSIFFKMSAIFVKYNFCLVITYGNIEKIRQLLTVIKLSETVA